MTKILFLLLIPSAKINFLNFRGRDLEQDCVTLRIASLVNFGSHCTNHLAPRILGAAVALGRDHASFEGILPQDFRR